MAPELESGRCGAVGGCVTKRSMVATSLGSSPTTSEDGSGPPPWPPWARPTCSMAGSSMDGPTLVQMAVPSQMGSSSRTGLVIKLVWLFWTTSSMTVSNGTILSVTTDVTSSAKISLLAISTSSDRTQMLSSLEQIQKEISHGILGIFQPWKILALK